MQHKSFIIISVFLIVFVSLFFRERYKFPVTLSICNNVYEDCFPVAKYDTMDSCQSASEKGGWLCDTLTDPENITCKPSHNSIATGLCSK